MPFATHRLTHPLGSNKIKDDSIDRQIIGKNGTHCQAIKPVTICKKELLIPERIIYVPRKTPTYD